MLNASPELFGFLYLLFPLPSLPSSSPWQPKPDRSIKPNPDCVLWGNKVLFSYSSASRTGLVLVLFLFLKLDGAIRREVHRIFPKHSILNVCSFPPRVIKDITKRSESSQIRCKLCLHTKNISILCKCLMNLIWLSGLCVVFHMESDDICDYLLHARNLKTWGHYMKSSQIHTTK